MNNILAADIGGTNSRFGRFELDDEGGLRLLEVRWLSTTESASFHELIEKLSGSDFSLKPEDADIVSVAIAGPVEDGLRSSPPLISWDVDISDAKERFGFRRTFLINDFIAQAYACISPVGHAAEQVLPGRPVPDATIGVIGAGTGLGKALLISDGRGGRIAVPSEGGHAAFSFLTKEEFEFQEFLLKERGERYITGNTVVSGGGISYIHRFLTGERLEPHEVTSRFSEYPHTHEWAARFYGRACRNFALETFTGGGLYIAGGVAAKTPGLVRHPSFEEEFRSSDTLAHLLEKIPVYLIRDENSGIWGAAEYARLKVGP